MQVGMVGLIIEILLSLTLLAKTHGHLHDTVRYYEMLSYDEEQLLSNHHRLRRWSVPSGTGNREGNELKLSFKAFGKTFDLRLKPDNTQHRDFKLILDGKPHPTSSVNYHHYVGHEMNDPGSYVHGSLAQGVFDGVIHGSYETYFIEPSDRYFETRDKKRDISHHSVIYRHSDFVSSSASSFCGVKDSANNHLQSFTKSGSHHNIHSRQSHDDLKTRCDLDIIADSLFYEHVTDVNRNEQFRVGQATALIRNIVLAGSRNFERTDFDGDGNPDGITFAINRISINTSPEQDDSNISNEFLGVEALLNGFSKTADDSYCLSYLFTYRDFDDGVLGLAFIPDGPEGTGGVCDKRRGTKSYNTGLVTLLNYGRRVTTLSSYLTFTHEAGHNFGANHDTEDVCLPKGNYFVMFAQASDGRQNNNDKFSSCSIEDIKPILFNRAQSSDDNVGCLKRADDKCGNFLIDEGEQCDCGSGDIDSTTGLCISDPCCNGTICALANDVECSPQEGPCCNDSCLFISSDSEVCSEETECAHNQTCNGNSAACPKAIPKSPPMGNTSLSCNDGNNYCVDGECTGTLCVPLGLSDCECEESELHCHVCCKLANGTCVSTILLAEEDRDAASKLPNNKGGVLGVGFPCNDFEGYCDFFERCHPVNSDGAIKRVTQLVQGTDFFNTLQRYYWAAIVGAVVLLGVAFAIVVAFHFCLPRPEHMKKRKERRRARRRRN